MMDRTHSDVGKKIAATIDDALADLILLGLPCKDSAATLMAHLAIMRIDDNERRRQVEQFAISMVWDVDDTGDGL